MAALNPSPCQFQGLSFQGVNVSTRHCSIPSDR